MSIHKQRRKLALNVALLRGLNIPSKRYLKVKTVFKEELFIATVNNDTFSHTVEQLNKADPYSNQNYKNP